MASSAHCKWRISGAEGVARGEEGGQRPTATLMTTTAGVRPSAAADPVGPRVARHHPALSRCHRRRTARRGTRAARPNRAAGTRSAESRKLGPRCEPMIQSGAPRRVQLRRVKDWRLPAGTVVVSRPSRWGNPGPILGDLASLVPGCAEDVAFRRYLAEHPDLVASARRDLRGHDLACWCRLDQAWCHADVWLEVANSH